MAINIDKAFEVDQDGISVTDTNGTALLYFASGVGDPTGSAAPINTWYVRNDNNLLYYKFGVGNNDWRQIRSNDLTFDPTGLLNFDGSETDVYQALAKLGNQSIGDIAEIENFTSTVRETTTSDGWVSKAGFPWTSGPKTAGVFSVRWFYEVGQTKASRNFGYRTLITSPTADTLSEIAIASVRSDNDLIQQSGFQDYALLADGSITVDVQYGQTTQGNSAIMQNVAVEVRRVGDLP